MGVLERSTLLVTFIDALEPAERLPPDAVREPDEKEALLPLTDTGVLVRLAALLMVKAAPAVPVIEPPDAVRVLPVMPELVLLYIFTIVFVIESALLVVKLLVVPFITTVSLDRVVALELMVDVPPRK